MNANRIQTTFPPAMKTSIQVIRLRRSQSFSFSSLIFGGSDRTKSASVVRRGEGCNSHRRLWTALALSCLFLSSLSRAADTGQTFATPEAAVKALGAAANAQDRNELRSLFGLATDELVAADQVQAKNDLKDFAEAFNQTNYLVRVANDRLILEVGPTAFPFPIPLAKQSGKWFFDTDAGKEELLNRRIGRNELDVLQVVRAYVDAQRDYASKDRDGDGVLEYAQKLASSPGAQDGLYWEPASEGELSPLGPLVAEARQEGYRKNANAGPGPQPFHGYYFKILKAQGKSAPGGKYDYVINGNMIGGFALVAWPAMYGESGIMTFIVNQQGRVYEKDLGSKTSRIASRMTRYDPDSSWRISPE
jgi:hypothetical protein